MEENEKVGEQVNTANVLNPEHNNLDQGQMNILVSKNTGEIGDLDATANKAKKVVEVEMPLAGVRRSSRLRGTSP